MSVDYFSPLKLWLLDGMAMEPAGLTVFSLALVRGGRILLVLLCVRRASYDPTVISSANSCCHSQVREGRRVLRA